VHNRKNQGWKVSNVKVVDYNLFLKKLWLEFGHEKDLEQTQFEGEDLGDNDKDMTLEIQIKHVTVRKELQFPIMLRQMTDKETKEYHLKKLSELIKKSLEKNPRQEKPSKEQERKMMEWMERIERMEFR
jgi:hypothetical protein